MKKSIISKISILVILSIFSINSIFAEQKKDALKLYKAGNYIEAIKVCEEEIALQPDRIEAFIVICWSLVANKQYSEAEMWASKGKVIAPYDQRITEVLAESKFYLGKNDEALSLFQDYIALVQSSASRIGDVYYFMGEIYIRKGWFHHADIAFSQAVRIEPLREIWWTRLAYARETAGEYKLALDAYNRALVINSQNLDAKNGKKRVMAKIR
ncbi:MAG: tetratricopeptide repeat protein [Treponemataceae bacterium]|nr:tetratricopeptide repeat protein [Treponemataceae bacterium]